MQESYGEGVASHTDPESCGGVRKGDGEALTGHVQAGLSSREMKTSPSGEPSGVPTLWV
jgi:hypothetical protein